MHFPKIMALAATMTAAAVAFAPAARAQPDPSHGARPPASTDASPGAGGYGGRSGDRFGRSMTLSQYQARFRNRIMQADTDQDGRVSLAEWTAYQAQRNEEGAGEPAHPRGRNFGDPTREFQMLDVNQDGYVTPAEIDAVASQRFTRMDANHDGVLTPEERHAMRRGADAGAGQDEPAQPQR